jgi:hypothetical protein
VVADTTKDLRHRIRWLAPIEEHAQSTRPDCRQSCQTNCGNMLSGDVRQCEPA